MTNPNIKKWLSPHLYEGINFEEAIPMMDSLVRVVRDKESPHLIIALIHIGLGDELFYEAENAAKFIAANVKGLDLVFAAHDHKTFSGFIGNGSDSVAVLEGGSKASHLSLAEVELEFNSGKNIAKRIRPTLISLKNLPADKNYNRTFRKEFLATKGFTLTKVGTLDKRLSSEGTFYGPSEYVDLIHALQMEESGADISFAAPLNQHLDIQPGMINFQDLMSIYPFENQLYVISMTGKEVKDYLEYSYDSWINRSGMEFNNDSGAGIIYEVHVNKKEYERVKIISMSDGTLFSPDSVYKVALTSYRANGGGDLLVKGAKIPEDQLESRVITRGPDIRGLLYNKIKKSGRISPEKLNTWKFVPGL
jgi:2',3'-cyclic-nucleotide 2'-phosphodiesterase/3'-nucleotidase